ncbi:ParB/RepB/Spo0J family partition protein [Arthrobacter sp. NPDC092385]|uniref:ParB/RepB/Spo0J family partition protein n=1 Tax=Arthrobacter sp. NPDC092385 TaxID=3363943 RepID=UPI0037FACB1E
MAEKRRGLGRGLGALIPSASAEEILETPQPDPEPEPEEREISSSGGSDNSRRQGGRPVDLFFERVTEDDVAEQPRSYSSALRSGINKNVLDAQTKRVAKSSNRKPPLKRDGSKVEPLSPTTSREEEARAGAAPALSEGPSGESAVVAVVSSHEAQARAAVRSEAGATRSRTSQTKPSVSGQDAEPGVDSVVQDELSSGSGTADAVVAGAKNSVSRETREDEMIDGIKDAPAGEAVQDADEKPGLVEVPGATFAELPVGAIHPNRKQPRVEFNEDELAELVHSIREIGVLQPVVVRPSQENGEAKYELVMGERRWRASREAGMETIPAIIRSTLDDDLLRDALLENLHRSALNPLEEAAAYQQLLEDFGCSHDELAGRLGRSRPQISNTIRLMKLPPLVQRRVAAGVLSAGHARALLGLGDSADMEKLAQKIVAEGLSVRSTEEIVALSGGLRRPSKPTSPRDGARHERLDYLATSLSDRLDTNVKITLGAKKGRVSIEFASVDDLNRIIGVLSPAAE